MARIPKSKLPEIHIDIDSHNENPKRRGYPKTGQLDARFTVTKMGMDTNGNHAVWVKFLDGRAKKIQTLYNLPVTHRDRALSPEAVDEILDYVGTRMSNPAPRKGTAKPRRASQITKKAPSKRLVKRRLANSEPGYFPNPVNPPIPERKITNFMVIMYRAIDVASQRTGYKIERQARLSYAQGLVTAALELGLLRSDERDEIMESLKDALRIK